MNTPSPSSHFTEKLPWVRLAVFLALVVWGSALLLFGALATCSLGPKQSIIERFGQLGDTFGIFNALASSLAAVFAVAAYVSQRNQFEKQLRDHRDHTIEDLVIRSSEHLPSFNATLGAWSDPDMKRETYGIIEFSVRNDVRVYNLVFCAEIEGLHRQFFSPTWGVISKGGDYEPYVKFRTDNSLDHTLASGPIRLFFSYTLMNGIQMDEQFDMMNGHISVNSDRIKQVHSLRNALRNPTLKTV